MREIVRISIDDITPSPDAILKAQSVPERARNNIRTVQLTQESLQTYIELCNPVAVLMETSKTEFTDIYIGEGQNESETPLEDIYRESENLALFVVTVGEGVCREISRLFDVTDFAQAAMLDATASEGADMAAEVIESHYGALLRETGRGELSSGTMRFSPGYCGWHISAQKKLFAMLQPQEIGIELNESYLMQPLKSVSGVIVSGPKKIFQFEDKFSFCSECATHSCRERIKALSEN